MTTETSGDHDGTESRHLDRVRALLAKAESSTFPDEAAAFTAKAHELMAIHAIDLAMIDAASGSGAVTSLRLDLAPPYARDKFRLLTGVATGNRCRAILTLEDKGRCRADVFGYQADLAVVEVLFTSLLLQAVNLMLERGTVLDANGTNRTRAYRHSFMVGFAITINDRLLANLEVVTRNADDAADGNVLPVLADRSSQVDDAVTEAFPSLGRMAATSVSSSSGLDAGMAAGRRADVGSTRVAGSRQALDA